MKYIVDATSSYKNQANKPFKLHVLTSDDLTTDSHIYVNACRKNGLQGMRHFRNGLKKIKQNKQGRYIEISNAPIFNKVKVYI